MTKHLNLNFNDLTIKLPKTMKKLAMGIDIGGTNTAFGLVDEEGTVFCESVI